ncbi:MAG: ribosomal protein S18-alanine N-acetyltransferase [Burkholderiaceae bacterium]
MSALAPEPLELALVPMRAADVEAVLAIEQRAYAQPWTRGNFIDSLAAAYPAFVLRDRAGALLGYFLAMKGVDEMHLLNITVHPAQQGRGLARRMLDALCRLCREQGCSQLWLEVRQGNERARAVYRHYGFAEVGLRRAYYPLSQGQREDAVLMSLAVPA